MISMTRQFALLAIVSLACSNCKKIIPRQQAGGGTDSTSVIASVPPTAAPAAPRPIALSVSKSLLEGTRKEDRFRTYFFARQFYKNTKKEPGKYRNFQCWYYALEYEMTAEPERSLGLKYFVDTQARKFHGPKNTSKFEPSHFAFRISKEWSNTHFLNNYWRFYWNFDRHEGSRVSATKERGFRSAPNSYGERLSQLVNPTADKIYTGFVRWTDAAIDGDALRQRILADKVWSEKVHAAVANLGALGCTVYGPAGVITGAAGTVPFAAIGGALCSLSVVNKLAQEAEPDYARVAQAIDQPSTMTTRFAFDTSEIPIEWDDLTKLAEYINDQRAAEDGALFGGGCPQANDLEMLR